MIYNKDTLIEGRSDFTATLVGDLIYIVGGFGRGALKSIETFNVITYESKMLTDLLYPVYNQQTFHTEDKLIICWGENFNDYKSIQQLDLSTNVVTSSNMTFSNGTGFCLANYNNKFYTMGGQIFANGKGTYSIDEINEVYSDIKNVSKLPEVNGINARSDASIIQDNTGIAYITGGYYIANGVYLSSCIRQITAGVF